MLQPWPALLAHAAEAWPAEACGLVLARGARGSSTLELLRARNRAPRGSFELDPGDLAAALGAAAREGKRLVAFYHSHADAPAILSAGDLAAMVRDGEPSWPGVLHVVVECRRGIPGALAVYAWEPLRGRFVTVPADALLRA